jgi:hypothetical protein
MVPLTRCFASWTGVFDYRSSVLRRLRGVDHGRVRARPGVAGSRWVAG